MRSTDSKFSKTHLKNFKIEGYAVIHAIIPPDLLQQLRLLFDDEINHGDQLHKVVNTVNGKNYVSNIEHLFYNKNLVCLELLGAPYILEIAASICGDDFLLVQEFGVIKMLGDCNEVLWHQDMLHQRTGNCFTMGIYLDNADPGDGCLRIVPKSHTSSKDICILKQEPYVEIAVKAGDILIHDMMLAHSSGLMQRNPIRRVLYFEFLSATQAIHEAIYSREQLYNRMRLQQLAVGYYQQKNPDQKQFEWINSFSIPPETNDNIYETLRDIHKSKLLSKPSAYCFENI